MLGFEVHEVLVFVTVADIFSFDDDAVNHRSVEGKTTGQRNHQVVGHVHQGGFGEDVHSLRAEREVSLQGSVVLDVGLAVVDGVEQVAAVGELDLQGRDACEVMEVECSTDIALVQVFRLADQGNVGGHVVGRNETELQLVFRSLSGEEAVQVTVDVATEVVTALVSVVPTTDLEGEQVSFLHGPCFVQREVVVGVLAGAIAELFLLNVLVLVAVGGSQVAGVEGDCDLALEVIGFGEHCKVGFTIPGFEVVAHFVVFASPEDLASFQFEVSVDVEVDLVHRHHGVFDHLFLLALFLLGGLLFGCCCGDFGRSSFFSLFFDLCFCLGFFLGGFGGSGFSGRCCGLFGRLFCYGFSLGFFLGRGSSGSCGFCCRSGCFCRGCSGFSSGCCGRGCGGSLCSSGVFCRSCCGGGCFRGSEYCCGHDAGGDKHFLHIRNSFIYSTGIILVKLSFSCCFL